MKPRRVGSIFFWLLVMCAGLAACAAPADSPAQGQSAVDAAVFATRQASTSTETPSPTLSPPANSNASPTPGEPAPGAAALTPTAAISPTVSAHLSVAYAKDEAVWLWAPDQPAQRLTPGGPPVDALKLSPDGHWIAFSRAAEGQARELWLCDRRGANLQRIWPPVNNRSPGAGGQPASLHKFGWSPVGTVLAFNTRTAAAANDDLFLFPVAAQNVEVSQLFPPGEGGDFVFSPAGEQIALITARQISLADFAGRRRPGALTYPLTATYSDRYYYPQPVWSPDGEFLRVAVPPINTQARSPGPTTLWRIDAAGAPQREGSLNAVSTSGAGVFYAPNLQRLAYLAAESSLDNTYALYLAQADGSEAQVYTRADFLSFEGWSPDSRHVVFSVTENATLKIGKVNEKTAVYTLPTAEGQRAYGLRWVDSVRFIYIAAGSGAWELRLGGLNTANELIDQSGQGRPVYDFAN